jgi:hypothetical protein
LFPFLDFASDQKEYDCSHHKQQYNGSKVLHDPGRHLGSPFRVLAFANLLP